MIGDLLRAFVEAVAVRQFFGGRIQPGMRIESLDVDPDGFVSVTWSEP